MKWLCKWFGHDWENLPTIYEIDGIKGTKSKCKDCGFISWN